MGETLKRFHGTVLLAALVLHVVAAWFSTGWYGDDEHYQVIAFAQHKLGELPANELPWEYAERIRSALLPGMAYAVILGCRAVGFADPFAIAFVLRLTTALVALLVMRAFVKAVLPGIRTDLHRHFILLSYFLWFLPYQHVRFAAETWSSLLLLMAVTVLLGHHRRRWFLAGLFLMICALLKPAMIAACGGLVLWALHGSSARSRSAVMVAAGVVAGMLTGFMTDRWFYGEPACTLWNQSHMVGLSIAGIIPSPIAPGTYPWYYYFPWIIKYGIWPIGGALLAALLWLTWRMPRAWPVWTVWPYLLLLSAVPHKELRFLFPLADLAPIVLVLAWQKVDAQRIDAVLRHPVSLAAWTTINTMGLVVACFTAAGSGRTRLAHALPPHEEGSAASIAYAVDPELIWKVRIPSFYLPDGMTDMGTWWPGTANAPDMLIATGPDRLLTIPGVEVPPQYQPLASSEPTWAAPLLWLYNTDRPPPYTLYARTGTIGAGSSPRAR